VSASCSELLICNADSVAGAALDAAAWDATNRCSVQPASKCDLNKLKRMSRFVVQTLKNVRKGRLAEIPVSRAKCALAVDKASVCPAGGQGDARCSEATAAAYNIASTLFEICDAAPLTQAEVSAAADRAVESLAARGVQIGPDAWNDVDQLFALLWETIAQTGCVESAQSSAQARIPSPRVFGEKFCGPGSCDHPLCHAVPVPDCINDTCKRHDECYGALQTYECLHTTCMWSSQTESCDDTFFAEGEDCIGFFCGPGCMAAKAILAIAHKLEDANDVAELVDPCPRGGQGECPTCPGQCSEDCTCDTVATTTVTTMTSSTTAPLSTTTTTLANECRIHMDDVPNCITANSVIETVAGGCGSSCTCDGANGCGVGCSSGCAPTDTYLFGPRGLDASATGEVFVSESFPQWWIRKFTAGGTMALVAGEANAADLAIGPDCSVYYLAVQRDCCGDRGAHQIRRIDPSGVDTVVAGQDTLDCLFMGDGGPATAAYICPNGLAVDDTGVIYIADYGNRRIRRIGLDGIITTVAGDGTSSTPGPSGDGGLATLASISPYAVDVGSDGALYIADLGSNRVRKVITDGTITSIAGGGSISCDGRFGVQCDGDPATDAGFIQLTNVKVGPEGLVYLVDFAYVWSVFRINASGVLEKVAGNGTYGFSGDGGPAGQAAISPVDLAFGPDGSLYTAENADFRIRRVSCGN
jgi:hypothetical protein